MVHGQLIYGHIRPLGCSFDGHFAAEKAFHAYQLCPTDGTSLFLR